MTEEKKAGKASKGKLGASGKRRTSSPSLLAGEGRFQSLIQNLADMIVIIDDRGLVSYESPSWVRTLGYPEDHFIGQSPFPFIHPDDLPAVLKDFADSMQHNVDGIPTPFRFRRADGTWAYLEALANNMMEQPSIRGIVITVRDVTERIRAQEALRESEEKYRTIIENMDSGYYEVDLQGTMIFCNPALRDFLGYDGAELTGLKYRAFMDEEESRRVFQIFNEVYRTGKSSGDFYWRFVRKDGRKAYSAASTYPLRNDQGAIVGFRGTVRDITVLKQIEDALREREETFRALAENSPDTIMRFDREHRHLYVNPAAGRQTGIPPEAFIGKTHQDLGFPDDLVKTWEEAINKVFGTGQPHRIEFMLPDQSWIDWLLVPEFDLQGEVKAVLTSARDITGHKKSEETLRESERRLANIVDFLPDATFVVDKEGRVIAWNRAMEEMVGVTSEEMIGKGNYEHAIPFYGERRPILVDLALRPDEASERKYTGISREGDCLFGESYIPTLKEKETFFWGKAAPLRDSEGKVVGAIESIRDITDRKKAEQDLQVAKEAADTASRAKGEFLANMSHEIRTPLNAIIGMSELALDMDLDEEKMGIILTISQEADHLLQLINEVLDFSKIEAGRLDLEEIPFDLDYLMDSLSGSFALQSEQKGLTFISFLSPDVPVHLTGDPGRLRQVMVNLIGNAVKFTQQGHVHVNVHLQKDSEDRATVHFSIRDTGVGIPADMQQKIFESFTQADGSTTRKFGGTGLGTTISKRLVELMGGRIGVESVEGQGSNFWFEVTFSKQISGKQVMEAAGLDLQGIKALIVDDEPTNRMVLREYLKSCGCETDEAVSGREALSTLKRDAIAGKCPDLVITDYQMPELDGFALAREIRKEGLLKELPIVLVTSVARLGDGRACRDLGIDGYLTKPVKRMDLCRVVRSVLAPPAGKEAVETVLVTRHTIGEADKKAVRILLTEDYPTNRQIALKHLTGAGYAVDIAVNGRQAVDAFSSQHYDLILMDIQMPVMDGYEAVKAIREMEALETAPRSDAAQPRIPIVAMTAHAMQEYLDRCIAAGMDDYLTKPMKRQRLLEMVEKWTGSARSSAVDIAPVSPATAQDAEEQAIFQYAQALEEFDNDRDFLQEVVADFIKKVDSQIVMMKEALEEGDAESLRREAHSIKGGAANLTAVPMSRAASALEAIAKTGNLRGAPDALEHLGKTFHLLEDELKKYRMGS